MRHWRDRLIADKLASAISAAVWDGGPDPAQNAALAAAIRRARAAGLDPAHIERALGAPRELLPLRFEAIGPGGVGMIVEGLTADRVRTKAALQALVGRYGGRAGNVAGAFTRRCLVLVDPRAISEPDLLAVARAAGAEVRLREVGHDILVAPESYDALRRGLAAHGVVADARAMVVLEPRSWIEVEDGGAARALAALIGALERREDVQRVTTDGRLPAPVVDPLTDRAGRRT